MEGAQRGEFGSSVRNQQFNAISGANDYNMLPGVPEHVHCVGHSFTSLLFQPSPLRSTLDHHYGWNIRYPNNSGLDIGFSEQQVVGDIYGSFFNGPITLSDVNPTNDSSYTGETAEETRFERGIASQSFTTSGHQNYDPLRMTLGLQPYSSLQPFEYIDLNYPPNHHNTSIGHAGEFGYVQGGNNLTPVEHIEFGGRLIPATPVELVPVMRPRLSRELDMSSFNPPVVNQVPQQVPAFEYGWDQLLSQAVGSTYNINESSIFSGVQQPHVGHATATQEHAQHHDLFGALNQQESQGSRSFLDILQRSQRRLDLNLPAPENHGSLPSEDDDFEDGEDSSSYSYFATSDDDDDFNEGRNVTYPEESLEQSWEEQMIRSVEAFSGNLTYETLLALQERIGYVNTGMTDNEVSFGLKIRYFQAPDPGQDIGSDETGCTICLGEYDDGDALGVLDCDHYYHEDCISVWLKKSNTCPLCRRT